MVGVYFPDYLPEGLSWREEEEIKTKWTRTFWKNVFWRTATSGEKCKISYISVSGLFYTRNKELEFETSVEVGREFANISLLREFVFDEDYDTRDLMVECERSFTITVPVRNVFYESYHKGFNRVGVSTSIKWGDLKDLNRNIFEGYAEAYNERQAATSVGRGIPGLEKEAWETYKERISHLYKKLKEYGKEKPKKEEVVEVKPPKEVVRKVWTEEEVITKECWGMITRLLRQVSEAKGVEIHMTRDFVNFIVGRAPMLRTEEDFRKAIEEYIERRR